MFFKASVLAAIVPLVAAHGFIREPASRRPGDAFASACGQQPFNQQSSDINGNVQGIMQVVGADMTADCQLWLCKGFQFDDNKANVQTYSAGQTIPFQVNVAAPHTGYANVSVVNTATNTIIGSPLIEWDVYASTAFAIPKNNTEFSVTLPDDLSECDEPGACVIQWFWDAPDISQTYESCVDFVVSGSGGESPSEPEPAPSSDVPAPTTVTSATATPEPTTVTPPAGGDDCEEIPDEDLPEDDEDLPEDDEDLPEDNCEEIPDEDLPEDDEDLPEDDEDLPEDDEDLPEDDCEEIPDEDFPQDDEDLPEDDEDLPEDDEDDCEKIPDEDLPEDGGDDESPSDAPAPAISTVLTAPVAAVTKSAGPKPEPATVTHVQTVTVTAAPITVTAEPTACY